MTYCPIGYLPLKGKYLSFLRPEDGVIGVSFSKFTLYRGGGKMKFLERFLSTTIYVITISMFVYMFATGLAITHLGGIHECPLCVHAEDIIR